MSTTVRPDNLRAALDAKLAAAMSQLVELREADQARLTLHLNLREIVETFLLHACRIQPIADTFGRAQAGDLQFDAWYGQWLGGQSDLDRALWKQLHEERVRQELGLGTALLEVELPIASPSSQQSPPAAPAEVRKRFIRFAGSPNRAASDVCDDYLRLARRFVDDFVRDYARFLP
jgi:hypothetical protein